MEPKFCAKLTANHRGGGGVKLPSPPDVSVTVCWRFRSKLERKYEAADCGFPPLPSIIKQFPTQYPHSKPLFAIATYSKYTGINNLKLPWKVLTTVAYMF